MLWGRSSASSCSVSCCSPHSALSTTSWSAWVLAFAGKCLNSSLVLCGRLARLLLCLLLLCVLLQPAQRSQLLGSLMPNRTRDGVLLSSSVPGKQSMGGRQLALCRIPPNAVLQAARRSWVTICCSSRSQYKSQGQGSSLTLQHERHCARPQPAARLTTWQPSGRQAGRPAPSSFACRATR